MVSGLCPRADPRTLNLIESACLLHLQHGWRGVPALGVWGGPKGPSLHDHDEALSFDTGEYFLKISRKYFTPTLCALREVQRELRNVCVISPVSWVYNKEFSILGTAGFICVWKAFGSSNLGKGSPG